MKSDKDKFKIFYPGFGVGTYKEGQGQESSNIVTISVSSCHNNAA